MAVIDRPGTPWLPGARQRAEELHQIPGVLSVTPLKVCELTSESNIRVVTSQLGVIFPFVHVREIQRLLLSTEDHIKEEVAKRIRVTYPHLGGAFVRDDVRSRRRGRKKRFVEIDESEPEVDSDEMPPNSFAGDNGDEPVDIRDLEEHGNLDLEELDLEQPPPDRDADLLVESDPPPDEVFPPDRNPAPDLDDRDRNGGNPMSARKKVVTKAKKTRRPRKISYEDAVAHILKSGHGSTFELEHPRDVLREACSNDVLINGYIIRMQSQGILSKKHQHPDGQRSSFTVTRPDRSLPSTGANGGSKATRRSKTSVHDHGGDFSSVMATAAALKDLDSAIATLRDNGATFTFKDNALMVHAELSQDGTTIAIDHPIKLDD